MYVADKKRQETNWVHMFHPSKAWRIDDLWWYIWNIISCNNLLWGGGWTEIRRSTVRLYKCCFAKISLKKMWICLWGGYIWTGQRHANTHYNPLFLFYSHRSIGPCYISHKCGSMDILCEVNWILQPSACYTYVFYAWENLHFVSISLVLAQPLGVTYEGLIQLFFRSQQEENIFMVNGLLK